LEARAHRRYRVWLPIRLSGDTVEASVAVSRDASEGGMLMSAVDALAIGTKVTLTFTVPGEPPVDHQIEGTITRITENADDPHGAWPYRVAVQFDSALPGLSATLAEIEDELSRSK
jgi:hypothetical protein